MDRYAVIGNPVAHSLSPEIHCAFAKQTGQRLSYEKLAAPAGGFREAADSFFAAGGLGLNVTLPFKGNAGLVPMRSTRLRWRTTGRRVSTRTAKASSGISARWV